jgi:hypothetical protein
VAGRNRVVRLERTGDRAVDEQFRRAADVLQKDAGEPTGLAGLEGVATLSAERVEWTPDGAAQYSAACRQTFVETADGTATTLAVYTPRESAVCRITANVTALKVETGDALSREVCATWKRVGGAPTQVGSTTVVSSHADAGAGAWTVAFDSSGNDVRIRVTGAASSTIRWSAILVAQTVG